MPDYPFELVRYDRDTLPNAKDLLRERPYSSAGNSFAEDARRFVPGRALETAINTAIAVGEPLLITGEAGTGKTQTAYYAAYKLGIEPVIHFQVKSDSTAKDLLYHFDTVRYFHDAHFGNEGELDKNKYIEHSALWKAFTSKHPCVLLIDEIDKAPRDFPNDLLHELDKMEFWVAETQELIKAPSDKRPIVFITSNSERRLPEPFLRRCVYHHIRFDDDLVKRAMERRQEEYKQLSDEFLKLAMRRFLALRERNLRKKPATGEFLVWLRVLALATDKEPRQLEEDLVKLPYLGVLLKDHQDIEELGGGK
ncbi:MAG: MoxR family ATPase [Candidatus Competibacteraceae bacterium]